MFVYSSFVDNSSIETGTGVVTSVDYNSNNLLELCSGGTTVYNPADYDAVLEQVAEFDNTFFLSLKNHLLICLKNFSISLTFPLILH